MRPIKNTDPSRCLLACAYPLTREDYNRLFDRQPPSDFFTSQFKKLPATPKKELVWSDLYSRFAASLTRGLKAVESCGGTVIRNFSIEHLAEVSNFEVFTLYAHYNQFIDRIELSDGLYSRDDFTKAIPGDYQGIFDLTLCNSVYVRNEIKKKFGSQQVISFADTIPIMAGMLFYQQLILNLSRYHINYIDCYRKTVKDLNTNDEQS